MSINVFASSLNAEWNAKQSNIKNSREKKQQFNNKCREIIPNYFTNYFSFGCWFVQSVSNDLCFTFDVLLPLHFFSPKLYMPTIQKKKNKIEREKKNRIRHRMKKNEAYTTHSSAAKRKNSIEFFSFMHIYILRVCMCVCAVCLCMSEWM